MSIKMNLDNISQSDLKAATKLVSKIGANQDNKEPIRVSENAPKELNDAISLFKRAGYTLSANDINEIKQFISSESGDVSEKFDAIKLAVSKSAPVDEQIFADTLNFNKKSLMDYLTPSVDLSLTKVFDERDEKNSANKYNVRHAKNNNCEQKSENVKQIVKKIDDELKSILDSLDISRDSEKSISDKRKSDSDISDDIAELKRLVQEIANGADDTMAQVGVLASYAQNREVQSNIKMILEERVTPKIREIKLQFDSFRKELNNSLSDIANNPNRPSNSSSLKDIIDKIDSAIMKSELTMYMSMRGERDLISLSTDLDKARTNLNLGKFSEAHSIIKEVVGKIADMEFKPSLKKVLITAHNLKAVDNFNDISNEFSNMLNEFSHNEKSANSVTQFLRGLGVNNESEIFQRIFGIQNSGAVAESFKNSENSGFKDFKNDINLKQVLLNLAKSDNISVGEKVKANAAISNINGAQYAQKLDSQKQIQEVHMNIPIKFQEETCNIKMFIKSPQDNLKLDYRNFNMFFALNTQNFGEIGIKVSSLDLKLKVSIQNDKLAKAENHKFAEKFKREVEDIGYNLVEFKIVDADDKILTKPPISAAPILDIIATSDEISEKEPNNFDYSV